MVLGVLVVIYSEALSYRVSVVLGFLKFRVARIWNSIWIPVTNKHAVKRGDPRQPECAFSRRTRKERPSFVTENAENWRQQGKVKYPTSLLHYGGSSFWFNEGVMYCDARHFSERYWKTWVHISQKPHSISVTKPKYLSQQLTIYMHKSFVLQ